MTSCYSKATHTHTHMQDHATIFAVLSHFYEFSLQNRHSLCHSTEAKNVLSTDFLKWSLQYVQTEGLDTAELIWTLLFAQTPTFTKPMPCEIYRSLLRLRLQLAAECNDGMLCRPSRNMGWGWVATWIYRTSASECQEGDFGCSCRPFGRTETCEVLTSLSRFLQER